MLAFLACVLAGMISFASPCVIPLVPGYLSYLSSMLRGPDPKSANRAQIVWATLCFVLGFTVVFILTSIAFFNLMVWLALDHIWLQRIGGIITMFMALVFLGYFTPLQNTKKLSLPKLSGYGGALLLGSVFALSWTPCLGPTLSGILSVTAGTHGMTLVKGIVFMVGYCLGLGVPFIVAALGSTWALSSLAWLRKRANIIHYIGGITLFIIGLLLLTGYWDRIIALLRQWFINGWIAPI